MAGVTTKAAREPARQAGTRFAPRPAAVVLAAGTAGLAAGTAGLLFLAYLRLSWTVPVTADGSAQALQARDMLAGNWRLHGWTISDVSFYTTELPEYVLVELLRPFGAGVIHVAAAVSYTLLVLGAFALARGTAGGAEGLVRGALAAAIMLAPQPGYGSFILLLSPDHTGTTVPLLLGWLLLDRAWSSGTPSRTSRWLVAAALCLLLALVQFADRIALLTAVLPLLIVCAVRIAGAAWSGRRVRAGRLAVSSPSTAGRRSPLPISFGGRTPLPISFGWTNPGKTVAEAAISDGKSSSRAASSDGKRGRSAAAGGPARLPVSSCATKYDKADEKVVIAETKSAGVVITDRKWGRWLAVRAGAADALAGRAETALALAAVASVGVAWAAARVLAVAGGFTARPLPFTLAPLSLLWTHARLTGWGILEVYGANFLGVTGPAGITFAALHLAGLALAVTGTGIALSRLLRRRPGQAAGLVDAVLAVAVVVNLVSYLVSIEPGTVTGTGYDAREIAAVLPLGAVLAGRLLGPELTRLARRPARHRGFGRRTAGSRPRSGSTWVAASPWLMLVLPLLILPLAGYPAALGYAAAGAAGTGTDQVLADWLVAHRLRYGLGGAAANAVTADSGGRAVVASTVVRKGRVRPLLYQARAAAYDPAGHDATFLVAGTPAGPGDPAEDVPAAAVRATFGPPSRIFRFRGFTVDVWDVNLLTRLG